MSARRSKWSRQVYNLFRDRSFFEDKGLDEDVVDLRYKHYQARLLDTINRIIE